MLSFKQVVKSEDEKAAVYVFIDTEKGHTVYMSHNGTMTVVEEEKKKESKQRAAGFLIGESDSCSDCNGC